MPSKKETLTVIVIMALFLLLTAACIGLRSEHLLMAALYLVLFFALETANVVPPYQGNLEKFHHVFPFRSFFIYLFRIWLQIGSDARKTRSRLTTPYNVCPYC